MKEMKNSGIEWIGEIPENWKVVPIKIAFSEVKTKNTDGAVTNALKFKFGEIVPKTNFDSETDDYVADTILNYTIVEPRMIMINGLNLNYDFKTLRTGLVKEKGIITSAYLALKPIEEIVNAEYATYLFKGYETKMAFHNMGAGIRLTLGFKEFKNQPLLLPSLSEQEAIADFLDKQCAEIDAVIEQTKATIEEYKKLKQAIITEAVTKGIRGDRPMKDSGIEWIDSIPVEWDISRTKVLFTFGKGLPITKENLIETGVPVISYGQIHSKTNSGTALNDDLYRFVYEEYLETNASSLVHANDFIVADTSEDLDGCGNCVFVDSEMVLFAGYHTIILRSNTDDDNKYLAYLFKTDAWRSQIRSKVSGVKLFSISKKILSDTTLLLPSDEERAEIVAYLDAKCAEIDALIGKKTALLEEMEALKKSIIFEYVTGKKEVASATEEVVVVVYPHFPSVLPTSKSRFAQAVLMSKILDSNVSNMGRVKLEKMLFTIEHSLGFDFDTEYHREAAGPLDSSIYQCERLISKDNPWFYVNASDFGVSYKARKDVGKYKQYYEKYFSAYNEEIERIISIFRTYTLDQAEIVATLYGAWNDMIIDKREFADEDVVDEVLNHWNESKKRFSKDVWLRAMETMRKNNLVPKGYGKHTIVKEEV